MARLLGCVQWCVGKHFQWNKELHPNSGTIVCRSCTVRTKQKGPSIVLRSGWLHEQRIFVDVQCPGEIPMMLCHIFSSDTLMCCVKCAFVQFFSFAVALVLQDKMYIKMACRSKSGCMLQRCVMYRCFSLPYCNFFLILAQLWLHSLPLEVVGRY